MKIAIVWVTSKGMDTAFKIKAYFPDDFLDMYCYEKINCCEKVMYYTSVSQLMQEIFHAYEAIVFVGACGIMVRAMSPFVESKKTDPAVVVIDEQGKYAIPILSGHIGGANALAEKLAEYSGCQAVITTATDIGGKFSPDSFAMANDLYFDDLSVAKQIAAAVLKGEKIGLYSDFPCRNIPEEYIVKYTGEEMKKREKPLMGICILAQQIHGTADNSYFKETLFCYPKTYVLGIGCRKHTEPDKLERFVMGTLAHNDIPIWKVKRITSIDLKKKEPALIELGQKYRIPFRSYVAEQLQKVTGEFERSEFVLQTTGVDNVCERSACVEGGKIVVKKISMDGMTIAIATENVIIDFARKRL